MPWKLVEVVDTPADEELLTDSELIGISIFLTHKVDPPYNDRNIYWRARQKIQPQVEIALTR